MSIELSIRKSFSNFSLDVSLAAGTETLGFLGASGCGKSLTLRCIAGLEKPDAGYIRVGERVFFDSERHINLSPQQRKTALLFQSYMLFPNMTVAENIRAGLPPRVDKNQAQAEVAGQLRRFGLEGFGQRYPMSLSGGQQQRVALARMLAAKPEILMLDEPFSALDAHLKEALEQDLLALFDDFAGTILYVSHDIDEAFRFCDRIAVYNEGRVEQLSPAADLLSHPATLATLKVSGVKNITPVRPLGPDRPTEVDAYEWGLVLDCARPVAPDTRWLGVRATNIKWIRDAATGAAAAVAASPAAAPTANSFEFTVRRVSDSRFERTVILAFGDAVGTVNWRTPKRRDSQLPLPQRGDHIRLRIPPESIYLVSR
jgi:molybdate transport system ATP-binding protein